VIANHWAFVLAAYGLAAVILTVYWRHLCRRERELSKMAKANSSRLPRRQA
jgi:hypothetical protein